MSRLKREIAASAVGELLRPEPGAAAGRYRFSRDFVGFSGHFPGYPVLPAIVQILAALDVAERMKARRLKLAGVKNAKFHIRIRPGHEVLVECMDCGNRVEEAAFDVRLLLGGAVAATFTLACAPAKEG